MISMFVIAFLMIILQLCAFWYFCQWVKSVLPSPPNDNNRNNQQQQGQQQQPAKQKKHRKKSKISEQKPSHHRHKSRAASVISLNNNNDEAEGGGGAAYPGVAASMEAAPDQQQPSYDPAVDSANLVPLSQPKSNNNLAHRRSKSRQTKSKTGHHRHRRSKSRLSSEEIPNPPPPPPPPPSDSYRTKRQSSGRQRPKSKDDSKLAKIANYDALLNEIADKWKQKDWTQIEKNIPNRQFNPDAVVNSDGENGGGVYLPTPDGTNVNIGNNKNSVFDRRQSDNWSDDSNEEPDVKINTII